MDIKSICFSLIAAGLLFGGPSQSFADFKTYPGSACQHLRVNDGGSGGTSYLNFSRRFNLSDSEDLLLDCPAVHDRVTGIESSVVKVLNQNPNETACATLFAFAQFGTGLVFLQSPEKCTQVTGQVWPLDTGGLTSFPPGAHLFFGVKLPKLYSGKPSGVVTYQVTESDTGD